MSDLAAQHGSLAARTGRILDQQCSRSGVRADGSNDLLRTIGPLDPHDAAGGELTGPPRPDVETAGSQVIDSLLQPAKEGVEEHVTID